MTSRDLTHQVVRAEDLRVGDIVVRHPVGRVVEVDPVRYGVSGPAMWVRGELGETWLEAADPVDVYREVSE